MLHFVLSSVLLASVSLSPQIALENAECDRLGKYFDIVQGKQSVPPGMKWKLLGKGANGEAFKISDPVQHVSGVTKSGKFVLKFFGDGGFDEEYEIYNPRHGPSPSVCEGLLRPIGFCKSKNLILYPYAGKSLSSIVQRIKKASEAVLGKKVPEEPFPVQKRLELTRVVLKQLSSTLTCLHLSGFIHTDIKPANIAVQLDPYYPSSHKVTLIDIGSISRIGSMINTDSQDTGGFTPFYFNAGPLEGDSGDRAKWGWDIGALGLTAVEIMTGFLPYQKPGFVMNEFSVLFKLRGGSHLDSSNWDPQVRSLFDQAFSSDEDLPVKDAILSMLAFRPEDRPRANEIFSRISGISA